MPAWPGLGSSQQEIPVREGEGLAKAHQLSTEAAWPVEHERQMVEVVRMPEAYYILKQERQMYGPSTPPNNAKAGSQKYVAYAQANNAEQANREHATALFGQTGPGQSAGLF